MRKFIVILAVFLMAVYYFISPQKIPQEGFFHASKAIKLEESLETNLDKVSTVKEFIPIKVGPTLAYLASNFTLVNLVKTDERLSISDNYYATYDSNSPGFTVYSPQGSEVISLKSNGVPLIFGERIFSVDHVAGLVNCYSTDGQLLWSYNAGAYVTSLSANEEVTVLGGLNGYVTVLNVSGQMIYEYRPSGSASEIIYGTAISPDGQYFAIISGLDPQRFLIFRKGKRGGYVPIYHRDLKQQFVQPVRIKFSKSSDLVLYEEPGLLNGYHIGTHEAFSLPINGKLKDFNTDVLGSYFGFLVERVGESDLNILNHKYLFPLMELRLRTDNAVIAVLPSSIVLGIDETLFLLNYEGKNK